MSRVRKAMYWLLDHWYIPALFIGAIVAFFIFKKKYGLIDDPLMRIAEELNIIDAGSEAREMQIQLGTEQAIQHVKDKYQAKAVALDAQQQATVKDLENDPVALARYLERLTR